MNELFKNVLVYLQNNGYSRASFERLIESVPGASTYEQLRDMRDAHPDVFREANLKGGLEGLALLDDVYAEDELIKLATAPESTSDEESKYIKHMYYRNVGSAVKADAVTCPNLFNTVICVLVTQNDFVIIGSAFAEDEDTAKERAYLDARNQLWTLEQYDRTSIMLTNYEIRF